MKNGNQRMDKIYKDLFYKLSDYLDDKSLVRLSSLNAKLYKFSKEEEFWKRRFICEYDPELCIYSYKPDKFSWKNYYISSKKEIELDISKVEDLIIYTKGYYKFVDPENLYKSRTTDRDKENNIHFDPHTRK